MVRPLKEAAAFAPVRRPTVVESIIRQIKGMLGRAARLPNERELARKLGVSRYSVRDALRTLARLGVLDTRHGRGTRVAASSENILKEPLELLVVFDRPSADELFETREVLEAHLAARAAERRTKDDLREMEAALGEMRAHVEDAEASTAADVRFHEAVAAAAHNRILQRFVSGLHDPLTEFIRTVRPGVRNLRRSVERHAKLLEAIRRKDAATARRLAASTMAETAREFRRVRGKRPGGTR